MIGKAQDGIIGMSAKEQSDLLSWCKNSYDQSRRFYSLLRHRWYLTERYLEGFQLNGGIINGLSKDVAQDYFTSNSGSNNVDEEYFVDNVLLPRYMRIISRLTRFNPGISVTPNTNSDSDKEGARIGKVLLYDTLERNDFAYLKMKIAESVFTYGKAFMKVTFDSNRGKRIKRPAGTELQIDPVTGETSEVQKFVDGFEGEIKWEVINPRNITVSPRARERKTLDWLQESNVLSVDDVFRRYGVRVEPQKVALDSEEYAAPSGLNYGQENREENLSKDAKVCLLHERWIRRCPDFPRGGIIVYSDNAIIRASELEDFYDDIPFFDAWCVYKSTSFWADTPLYHALPHQDEVNRLETHIMRHTKLIATPKFLIHATTKIGKEDMTDETGEFVEWQGEKKPEWLMAPELPQAVYENLNRTLMRIDDIVSVHDIVKARSGMSGNTVAFMQELDESNYSPVTDSIGMMLSNAAAMSLKIAADWYDIPRVIRMSGRDGTTIEQDFQGSMLNGNFTAHCEMMQGLPVNKLARQQVIFQSVDKKILTPEKAGRYLEFGEYEEALAKQNEEYEIANRACRLMETGITVPVHAWDNHAVFIEVMQSWMRRKYDNWVKDLGQNGLKIQQLFSQALDMHQKAVAISMQPANNTAGPIPGLLNADGQGIGLPGGGPPPGSVSGMKPPMPKEPIRGKSMEQPTARVSPPSGSLQNA